MPFNQCSLVESNAHHHPPEPTYAGNQAHASGRVHDVVRPRSASQLRIDLRKVIMFQPQRPELPLGGDYYVRLAVPFASFLIET